MKQRDLAFHYGECKQIKRVKRESVVKYIERVRLHGAALCYLL